MRLERRLERRMDQHTNQAGFSGHGSGHGQPLWRLKPIDPVGHHGQLSIDDSIYDAKRAGFDSVIFIIKARDRSGLQAGRWRSDLPMHECAVCLSGMERSA